MKKFISLLIILSFCLLSIPQANIIKAEDIPDFCDLGNKDAYDKQRCSDYIKQSSQKLNELKSEIENAENDLEKAQQLATSYAKQAANLDVEITELNVQIAELQDKIDALIVQIEENQIKVDELNKRVLARMESAQKTMHFNPYLNFILKATGFDDMLRRAYAVEAIAAKDEADRNELKELITRLENDKEELNNTKTELDAKRYDLLVKQEELVVMRDYWFRIQEETEAMIAELRNALEEEKRNYSNLVSNIGDISGIPTSEGFYRPVPGATVSAGVWRYPASFGGGVHLGVDYAVGAGTTVYAPMNGVVIVSSNSCASYGYLGNGCPYDKTGVYGGGNQVIMIGTAVDSNGVAQVYGVSFFHLQADSPVGTGVIMQGDYIGKVGSSGNSTGPHCHIELYYLGPGNMANIQNDYLYRNYSLGFNCGWMSYGLQRLCENGVGAPCRLNPRLYFGG